MDNKSLKPLVIAGAGGLGREVAWLVTDINSNNPEWDFMGFVDDGVQGSTVEGYSVLGPIAAVMDMRPIPQVAIAIADSTVRSRLVNEFDRANIPLATLIHPSVMISEYVAIGEGSIICAGCILTTNIKLGLASIINLNCTIGHDVVLQDYVSLMPGVDVAGEVTLGTGVYMGIHSNVINRTSIGEWSVIGAGAVVTRDIPSYSLAVGVPARVIKELGVKGKE